MVGKNIYVKPGKYYERLVNLNKELGGGILIHQVTNDSIITQVAQGKIPYTVADNDVAKLNATYYPNLNTSLSISFDQRASWAVRKDCPQLAAAADEWHKQNMTSPAYTASMKRYFEISKAMPHSPILSLKEGKICARDRLGLASVGILGLYRIELRYNCRIMGRSKGTDAINACHRPCNGGSTRQRAKPGRKYQSCGEIHCSDRSQPKHGAG